MKQPTDWFHQCISNALIAADFLAWFADKLLPPLVAGIAIALIASFAIPRANERYRAKREHLFKSVDGVRSQLETLVKIAAEYYKTTGRDPIREAQIEYLLQDISTLVEICAPSLWQTKESIGPQIVSQLALECITHEFAAPNRAADLDRGRMIAMFAAELAATVTMQRRTFFHRD